jgi:hypothetical protein
MTPPPYTPLEIVAAWRTHIKACLLPWVLEDKCFTHYEPLLTAQITKLLNPIPMPVTPPKFTQQDMDKSLQVAGDIAQICKILQPLNHTVMFDTYQIVHTLCAKRHQVCQGPAGAGGWCDV